jgi:phosphomannomutase
MAQLIVSISGIRGLVGDGLGADEAFRFGRAYGTHLGGGVVVLGRDSRPSGPMLAAALRAGLAAAGCRVIDCGILSTPGVGVMVRHLKAAGGAVITASHNPLPYNGIKLIQAAGMALSREAGKAIVDLYARQAGDPITSDETPTETRDDAAAIHVERVLGVIDAAAIRAAGLRVAVDAVNGAGGAEMRMLLERLECRCVAINEAPTGRFGRGAEPIAENLGDLSRTVRQEQAAVGFALDPDADRLALVAETGQAIGEEFTLALVARHRLSQARGPVACNLSTSRMMDDVAAGAGVTLVRTPVGELNVAEAIAAQPCVIGGEGNGGVIDPRVVLIRDSLAGAALVLEMLARRRKKLSELTAELSVYSMVKDKVTLGSISASAVLAAVQERFAGARVDVRDGLYLAWKDGWLHVRASNTEPVLRILAEAPDAAEARERVRQVKAMAGGKA